MTTVSAAAAREQQPPAVAARPSVRQVRRGDASGFTAERLFICDPVCAAGFGHNLAALRYFRRQFSPYFGEITCLGSYDLPEATPGSDDIQRFFTFVYGCFLAFDMPQAIVRARRSLQFSLRTGTDFFIEASARDFRNLFLRSAISSTDLLFLPSADFYATFGLLRTLAGRKPQDCPRVHLRLIGVMENAAHIYPAPLEKLLSAIGRFISDGFPVRVSAETPAYADHLAASLGVPVPVTPFPLIGDSLPLAASTPFTVYYAGSARLDKGWTRVPEIVRRVRRKTGGGDIKFLIQGLPDREAGNDEHGADRLYAMPGVELLPSELMPQAMRDAYCRCHAVLMPYSEDIYRLRGSAIWAEAISLGRFGIATGRLGFSAQLMHYNAGCLCASDQEFADAIIAASRTNRNLLETQMRQARARYAADVNGAYKLVAWS